MKYSYPCIMEPEDDEKYKGWFNVSFPDLEGAFTSGRDWKTAMIMAEDCMVVSLASYVDRQKELPTPSAWAKGQEIMTVQPLIAAQLNLYVAMREQGVTASDLERRLNIAEDEVKRLLSLDYKTSINEVVEALELLGCKPAVEDLAA
jgi:predicted RNase H-like HicB family nuclease